MKIFEEINHRRKEFVFEQYTRIVEDFKDYDKVTRKQMIKEIYKVYENPQNIIDICTERELRYLKMYLDGDKEYLSEKYEWERTTLCHKYLIGTVFEPRYGIELYEESTDLIKKAISMVKWSEVKRKDKLNEFLVSICKIEGTFLLPALVNLASGLLQIDEETIYNHIENNRVFKYYVCEEPFYIESVGNYVEELIFIDYYEVKDALEEERMKQGTASFPKLTTEDFKSIFYNDFNMNNKIIKKFYNELNKLPFFAFSAIKPIQEYALLNKDRTSLKKAIASVPALRNYNLTEFFKLMDEAMDEMPSGALNGITPNELKKLNKEKAKLEINKIKRYVKQTNAHLNQKDVRLFYDLYFGLLDYTNQKYNIKPNYKIYKRKGINPNDIIEIVLKFWENKETIVDEFCKENPFRFNKEERNLVKEFKKGIRETFTLANYEEEYTALMTDNKIYMIKGLNDNLDNIIPYENLPQIIITSIIPYKGYLVYDGIIQSYPISFGPGINQIVEEQYDKLMKYYHL